ncbi:MAG TPA: glycosyltransferase family 2 protein [Vicinamibacteria bacterium]
MTKGKAAAHVAVVVVSYNTRDDLRLCLRSLSEHVSIPLEVVVVDNASDDGSAAAAREERPEALVIENDENLGFAAGANRGWRASTAPCVLFLNSDAEVLPGALESLVAALESRPDVGIVGPRTLGSDGRIQVSTGPRLTPFSEWSQRRLVLGVAAGRPEALRAAEARHSREHEPFWVSGSCLLVGRSALEAVGGFDEAFFLYEEDVDLCARVREAGWRVVFTPAATVRHRLGRSMEKAGARPRLEYHRSHLLYYRKHNGRLATFGLRLAIGLRGVLLWLSGRGRELGRSLLALAASGQ